MIKKLFTDVIYGWAKKVGVFVPSKPSPMFEGKARTLNNFQVLHSGRLGPYLQTGNTKGGSISVLLTSCLTGLDQSVLQIKTEIVSCYAADSKPVKQEVNGTMILPPLVFPACKY
jgi:hypothetical protein